MIKNFVLDTNVLLHDSRAIFGFEDNVVCLPITVLEEIDNFKRDMSELGRSAREVVRFLDDIRKEGDLKVGVPVPSGGTVRVIFANRSPKSDPGASPSKTMDDRILMAAIELKDADKERPTIFVSKDINLRIRAEVAGIKAEDYDRERIDISEVYSGFRELEVADEVLACWFTEGSLHLEGVDLYPNEFVVLHSPTQGGDPVVGRFDAAQGRVVPVANTRKHGVFGIRARNREQVFAFDLLMNDAIKLVTLIGKAGTGKTLLALAAGVHKVTEESNYTKMLVSRPVIPLGRDIGYLPGDIEEKMAPWMKPIYDNLEFLMHLSPNGHQEKKYQRDMLPLDGVVDVEPLAYLRGRSIPNQYIIIDEAQNLTPHEVKTIITRAGDGTKIILTGDPYQIDNPYLDSVNNGLTTLVQKFRGQPIAGTMTLMKGERSELAEVASNLL
jgi:PhoH-like ATPase